MAFETTLDMLQPPTRERTWIYVAYDQLTDEIGPLARMAPEQVGIVLVESLAKAGRRPYHKQKLALLLANQRHFALEQATRGVAVDYRMTAEGYGKAILQAVREHGPLLMMEAAERELRQELAPLVSAGMLVVEPHTGWLTTDEDFSSLGDAPWRMDAFYRRVRRRTGWLMESGKPEGGRFSFDGENRQPWKGSPLPPTPPRFREDAIKREVCQLVAKRFADHPGRLDVTSLPATRAEAESLWQWALTDCLEHFGTWEDAMTRQSRGLFHTRIAPLLNLHRLLPGRLVADVARSSAPLNSREGFIRQVLGWREFVRHVHRATDGMRTGPGGSLTDPLQRQQPLPPAFWEDVASGMRCLDDAVDAVWDEGWTHHIVRLMVLANLATLMDVRPKEVSDWFWVGFIDAFDWVVEPNVLGMGTFGVGDIMTTKPYISGANYLNKMGDACADCSFHPKKSCPITPMYWAFLARHEEALRHVDRMTMPMRSLAKRAPEKREQDARIFHWVMDTLGRGEELHPLDMPTDTAESRRFTPMSAPPRTHTSAK